MKEGARLERRAPRSTRTVYCAVLPAAAPRPRLGRACAAHDNPAASATTSASASAGERRGGELCGPAPGRRRAGPDGTAMAVGGGLPGLRGLDGLHAVG
jgi:hypothetical protein